MIIPLVIYAALLTIPSIVHLFSPDVFNFSGRCYWVRFLLFVVSKIERFCCEVILRFSDNNSGYFCALKVLVNALVLSLDKNVSIRDAKSA